MSRTHNQTIEYYDKHTSDFISSSITSDMSLAYSRFLSLIPSDSKILDLGCGSGRDTLYFSSKRYSVIPVDGSIEMCKASEKLTGIPARCLLFENLDYEKEFDGVWASASLLHVPKSEIERVLERIQRALKPNGILYVSFKYGDGERIDEKGRFYNDYSEKDLKFLFEPVKGLRLTQYWFARNNRPTGSERWLNLIYKKGEK